MHCLYLCAHGEYLDLSRRGICDAVACEAGRKHKMSGCDLEKSPIARMHICTHIHQTYHLGTHSQAYTQMGVHIHIHKHT